jgi:hypothetical protein
MVMKTEIVFFFVHPFCDIFEPWPMFSCAVQFWVDLKACKWRCAIAGYALQAFPGFYLAKLSNKAILKQFEVGV